MDHAWNVPEQQGSQYGWSRGSKKSRESGGQSQGRATSHTALGMVQTLTFILSEAGSQWRVQDRELM